MRLTKPDANHAIMDQAGSMIAAKVHTSSSSLGLLQHTLTSSLSTPAPAQLAGQAFQHEQFV